LNGENAAKEDVALIRKSRGAVGAEVLAIALCDGESRQDNHGEKYRDRYGRVLSYSFRRGGFFSVSFF